LTTELELGGDRIKTIAVEVNVALNLSLKGREFG
jgi:hypothetical protein